MQVKLVNALGEVMYLPAEMSVEGFPDETDIPGTKIEGRDGRRTDYKNISLNPRTIRITGTMAGVDKDDADLIRDAVSGFVNRNNPIKIYRYEDSPNYVTAYKKSVNHSYRNGYFNGRLFTMDLQFQADDPYMYAEDEQVVEGIFGAPSGRVEAENPNATPGLADVRFVGNWWLHTNNTAEVTNVAKSYVKVSSVCTGIAVNGFSGGGCKFSVYIDDILDFSGTPDGTDIWKAIYTKSGLTPGTHVFKIISESSNYFYIDSFDIIGSPSALIDNPGTAASFVSFSVEPAERSWAMDFMGKTAGSIVSNRHVTYAGTAVSSPASLEIGGESGNPGYALTQARNNVSDYWYIDIQGNYFFQRFQFDLSDIAGGVNADIKAVLRGLDIEFWGYGKGWNKTSGADAGNWEASLKIWNKTTSAWDVLGNAGMSFTRDSVAYKEDGTAVAKGAPRFENGRFYNLLTKNQSDIETGTNDFGINNSGTTLTRDTSEKYEGLASLKVSCDGLYPSQGVFLPGARSKTGKAYIFSFYAKSDVPSGVSVTASIGSVTATFALTNTWTRYSFKPVADSSAIFAIVKATAGAANFWLDGIQLEEALPGQTQPTPWRPGGAGKALMVEEGTTTLIPLADQKFAGTWIAYGGATATLSQNQPVPAEWGTGNDATRIQTAGGANPTKYYKSMGSAPVAGTILTTSLWVKNQGATNVNISDNVTSVTVTPGESKRVVITSTFDGAKTNNFCFNAVNASDAIDIIAWRPQVEAKAYATSWTDGTRANETCKIPIALDPNEGTISVFVKSLGAVHDWGKLLLDGDFSIETNAGGQVLLYWNNHPAGNYISAKNNQFVCLTVRWSKSGNRVDVFEDGVKKVSIAYTIPVFSDTLFLGVSNTNKYWENVLFDNLRISNVARTDSEIMQASGCTANLAPTTADKWEQGAISAVDGTKSGNPGVIRTVSNFSIIPGVKYMPIFSGAYTYLLSFYSDSGSYLGYSGGWLQSGATVTPPVGATKACLQLKVDSGTVLPSAITTIAPVLNVAQLGPMTWDANTTYLQDFDDNLGAVCPVKFTKSANLSDYVTDDNKVHILAVSAYPADGTGKESAVYTDYIKLTARTSRIKQPTVTNKRRNLLTANQASVETDLAGLTYYGDGSVIAKDNSLSYVGKACVKCVAPAEQMGFETSLVGNLIGSDYTFSAWIRGVAGKKIKACIQWYAGTTYIVESYRDFTLTGIWQRIYISSPKPSNATACKGQIRIAKGETGYTFGADAIQLEEGSTATPFEMPGTDILSFNSAVDLNPGSNLFVDSGQCDVLKDGVSIADKVNLGYLLDGFMMASGKNHVQFSDVSPNNGLMKVSLRHRPKFF